MTGASALTLMVIVIHRYLKICTPSGRQMTHKWKKIFLAIIFCGMVLVALPCFAFYGSGSVTSPSNNLVGQWCTGVTAGQPKVAVAYKVILFLLVFRVLVVLVVLYSLIGRVLYKRGMFSWKPNFTKEAPSATFDSGTLGTDNVLRLNINGNKSKTDIVLEENKHAVPASHNVHSNAMDMQLQKLRCPGHRLTVMFMIIAAVYVISFIPKLAMMILESRKTDFWLTLTPSELGGYRFLYTINIINNVVNPLVYGLMDKTFQTEFKALLCKTG